MVSPHLLSFFNDFLPPRSGDPPRPRPGGPPGPSRPELCLRKRKWATAQLGRWGHKAPVAAWWSWGMLGFVKENRPKSTHLYPFILFPRLWELFFFWGPFLRAFLFKQRWDEDFLVLPKVSVFLRGFLELSRVLVLLVVRFFTIPLARP